MKHEWPIVEVGTRQWIFDKVLRHYRAQPRRCPAEGECYYRLGEDRCFGGELIDDYYYTPAMEGRQVRELMNRFRLPVWFHPNIDLIEGLQRIHDNSTNWAEGIMPMVLEMFAKEHGLEMPDETVI